MGGRRHLTCCITFILCTVCHTVELVFFFTFPVFGVQVEGVQFMYDNLVVNTEQLRDGGEGAKGNGCILAHCMGLGKTLQV